MKWRVSDTVKPELDGGIRCLNTLAGSLGKLHNNREGLWSPTEGKLHINLLEMMAETFAVETFMTENRLPPSCEVENGQHHSSSKWELHSPQP